MHRCRAVPRLAAILAVVALAVSSCSSDGDGNGDGDGGATSTTAGRGASTPAATQETGGATTSSTQAPADPDDVALAQEVVLTLDELPAGWAEDPSPQEGSTFDDEALHEQCPEVARTFDALRERQGRETGKARAGFLLGDQGLPGIQSSVVVAGNVEIAGQGYRAYVGDEFLVCLTQMFLSEIAADGSTAGAVQTTPLPVAPVGDAAAAARITVPITANGSEVTVFLDYVVIRVDRVLHLLLFGSADLFPLPDGTETQVIAAAAAFEVAA